MALLLRRSDVSHLLDLRQAMRVLEQTFREQSAGNVKQVPPLRFMNRGMRMVVGGLEAQNKNGLRVSVTGGESLALLFEISSGELLAIMGYPFSNLRIGATVGLAIERVFVYSRHPESRESFARNASEKLKIPVRAVNAPEQAVNEADLVLVSTNSPVAALLGQWLRPGLSVFGVGRPNEFDDAVYLRANLICVTSKTHELGYYDTKLDQPLIRLSQQGMISWDGVVEFSDIVCEKVAVPSGTTSIGVFRDSQGGYGDMALAAWAYEEARKRGLGQEISTD